MADKENKNLAIDETPIQEDNVSLLEEVKSYLKITWEDEDEHISKLIIEAKQHLSEKVGAEINFLKDFSAKRLLKEYCRYVRNYSKEYFEQNFINDILFLQLKYANSEDWENGKSQN